LPNLSPNDVVYTAGAPAMTESVARIAKAAGARCYSDPFVSNAKAVEQTTLLARVAGWLNNGPQNRPVTLRATKPPGRPVSSQGAVQSARSA